MDTDKVPLLVILILMRGTSLFLFYIIWSYLNSKIPAMQTLMDEMIKELIMAIIPMSFASDLIHIGLEPISKEKAFVMAFLKFGLGQYFLMQVLIVTIIKYFIIFYGPFIELINDR